MGSFKLADGSPLSNFLEKTKTMGPTERGRELESTKELQEMSDATAASGQTQGAGTDDANDSHFICFVNAGGTLFELDGRNVDDAGVAFPVSHGPTSAEAFVEDA